MNLTLIAIIMVLTLAVVLLIYGVIHLYRLRQKRKILRINYVRQRKSQLDLLLDKITAIQKLEKRLRIGMALLDSKHTERDIVKYGLLLGVGGLITGIVFLKNYVAALPLAFVGFYLPLYYIESVQVDKRRALLNDQLKESFQNFLTEYTTVGSVEQALYSVCETLPDPIRGEYERLSRKINSGANTGDKFAECMYEFAERLQNKWARLFAELMVMNNRTGAAFEKQLEMITHSMNEEVIMKETNSTELSGVSTVNFVLNLCVPIVFVINRFLNPEGNKLFTTTPQGKTIVVYIIIASIISLTAGSQMKKDV